MPLAAMLVLPLFARASSVLPSLPSINEASLLLICRRDVDTTTFQASTWKLLAPTAQRF